MGQPPPEELAMPMDVPPSAAVLLQMMTGYWVSQAIYVAAKLGLADLLADGPMTYEDLAASSHAHADSLRRMLRALASVGVFTESAPGHIALTPMAALLQAEAPGSMRPLAFVEAEVFYKAWGDFLHSVQTGEPAFSHHFGMPVFDYFAQHPHLERLFNETGVAVATRVNNATVATYDFSPFQTVVDVGGGYGALLAAILQSTTSARGILFDQPQVVTRADEFLTAAGVADRCTRIGGDFFEAIPPDGNAYVLSQILHDWDDDRCTSILKQCRRVMSEDGKLIVIEIVLPPGEEPSFGKWLDLQMLAIPGGRERTAGEYATLFHAAGFELTRVVPTPAGPSAVEAVPV